MNVFWMMYISPSFSLCLRFLMYIRHSWIGLWPQLTPVGSEWKKFRVLQCFPITAKEVHLFCAVLVWDELFYFSVGVCMWLHHHQSFKQTNDSVPALHTLTAIHPQIKQASPVSVSVWGWGGILAVLFLLMRFDQFFYYLYRRYGVKGSHVFCLLGWQSQISFIIA